MAQAVLGALVGSCSDNSAPTMPTKKATVAKRSLKSSLCHRFSTGNCEAGERCRYAHGPVDLRRPPAREAPALLPGTGGLLEAAAQAPVLFPFEGFLFVRAAHTVRLEVLRGEPAQLSQWCDVIPYQVAFLQDPATLCASSIVQLQQSLLPLSVGSAPLCFQESQEHIES